MMRSSLFLTIVLIIWAQDTVHSKQINDELIHDKNGDILELRETSEDYISLRDLNEIKNKIKKGILLAWEVFKVAAKNANTKITKWVEQEKDKVNKLNKIVVDRLDKLKNEFEDVVTKITVTGDNVKDCLKENKNNIQNIFSAIVSNMKKCLSNNVNKLTPNLEISNVLLDIDDTTFLTNVGNKISTTCKENDEKCLNDVQDEIITEIEEAAQNLSNQHLEARNAIDDRIHDTVICITESLTMAAKTIADGVVQIVGCVKNRD